MPMPNYHSFRLKNPSQFDRFSYKKHESAGVDLVIGWKNNHSEIQAVRFDKDKFDMSQARKWMKEHNFSAIKTEKAKETNENIVNKIEYYLVEKNCGIDFGNNEEELNEMFKIGDKIIVNNPAHPAHGEKGIITKFDKSEDSEGLYHVKTKRSEYPSKHKAKHLKIIEYKRGT
jgi:hypothetical protein